MHVLFLVWSSYPPEKIYADPSVFYRCYHPAEELRYLGATTSVLHFSEVEPASLSEYDFIIFFRPQFSEKFLDIYYAAQQCNLICIASYDDLFFDINMLRQSNFRGLAAPQHAILATRPHNYAQAMYFFDYFISSTDHLGEKIKSALPESSVHTQYNAVSSEMLSFAGLCNEEIEKNPGRIGYFAGGASHLPDIEAISGQLADILTEEDAEFFCVETLPVPDEIQKTGRVVTTPRMSYFGMISAYATCAVTIAPLHINEFTKAKSGIKSLEASLVGAVCVGSPIPDLERVAGDRFIPVTSINSWQNSLREALQKPTSKKITNGEHHRLKLKFTAAIEAEKLMSYLKSI